jgi:hypothetical protein
MIRSSVHCLTSQMHFEWNQLHAGEAFNQVNQLFSQCRISSWPRNRCSTLWQNQSRAEESRVTRSSLQKELAAGRIVDLLHPCGSDKDAGIYSEIHRRISARTSTALFSPLQA